MDLAPPTPPPAPGDINKTDVSESSQTSKTVPNSKKSEKVRYESSPDMEPYRSKAALDVPMDIEEDMQAPEDLVTMKEQASAQIQQFGQFLRIMEARMTSLEAEMSSMKPSDFKLEAKSMKEELDGVPESLMEVPELQSERDQTKEFICQIKVGDAVFFDRVVEYVYPSPYAYPPLPPDTFGPLPPDPFGSPTAIPSGSRVPHQNIPPPPPPNHTINTLNQSKNPEFWVIEVLMGADMPKPSQLDHNEQHPADTEDSSLAERHNQDALDTSKIQSCERIRIRSIVLLNYLSELGAGSWDALKETLVFVKPFKFFMKHENEIRARTRILSSQRDDKGEGPPANSESLNLPEERKTSDGKLLSHLQLLVELFDSLLKPTIQQYHAITSGTATHVAFDNLYYLFNYGQEVVCTDEPNQLRRVYAFGGGREPINATNPNDPPPPFKVECYHYASNVLSYGPVAPEQQPLIGSYPGYREITSLPVYPLEFHPRAEEIRERIVKRGARFIELSSKDKVIHRQYTGISLDLQPEEVDSQVIIDESMAMLHNPAWNPKLGVSSSTNFNDLECARHCPCNPSCTAILRAEYHQDLEDDRQRASEYFSKHKFALQPPEGATEPPKEDHILLPHFVYGFVLRSRKWAMLSLDAISPIEYKNSFDRLVLPDGHAEAVRALVQNHNRGPKSGKEGEHIDMAMDLVRGKGKGLIILLHGEPGVGKTSTAETIADFTKRPLYPITCGDIGSQAERVEENLERTFQLAHKWGCVLLLDEADVFLQERARDDIERNAIVSVFLRVMEYYSGILFLTTNRVGTIDQAFRSRIHLSLYYPALSEDVTLKIWRMNIETAKQLFEEMRKDIIIDDDEILRFAKRHYREMEDSGLGVWNGRQIRNAFQTALALSEMKATKLSKRLKLTDEQFKTVAKTSKAFDDYLLRTQGGTSARLAKQHRLRNDEVNTREVYKRSPARKSHTKTRRSRKYETTEEETSETSSSSSESEDERRKGRKKSKAKKKAKNEETEELSSLENKPVKKEKKKSKKRDDED